MMSLFFALAAMAEGRPDANFDLPGRTVIARFHAEGAQVYACTAKPEGGALSDACHKRVAFRAVAYAGDYVFAR